MELLFNDEHRDKYIHTCINCNSQVLSYRVCDGEHHSRECEGTLKQTDFILAKPYDFSNCKKSNGPIFTGGQTYYEKGLGREVNTRDIDRICKQEGLVYGGEDLTHEANRNKQYNKTKFKENFRNGLATELRKNGY